MGYGRWDNTTYSVYAASTGYTTKGEKEVFKQRHLRNDFSPRDISIRESVDSDESPNSIPVIFGLDVSGSMGQYAHQIAVKHLPKLMSGLIETSLIEDPHLMFMGIDDVHWNPASALQVSQFESDIRILEQLRDIWLVGGGGGNATESYDLAWYFAAYKTKIDSYNKRGIPGFLFTIGDEEAPHSPLNNKYLHQVFGDGEYAHSTPQETLAAAGEKYQIFHIVIEEGDYCRSNSPMNLRQVKESWTKLLGNNVLFLNDVSYLTELVLATIRIANGEDIHEVINSSDCKDVLRHAFENSLGVTSNKQQDDSYRTRVGEKVA